LLHGGQSNVNCVHQCCQLLARSSCQFCHKVRPLETKIGPFVTVRIEHQYSCLFFILAHTDFTVGVVFFSKIKRNIHYVQIHIYVVFSLKYLLNLCLSIVNRLKIIDFIRFSCTCFSVFFLGHFSLIYVQNRPQFLPAAYILKKPLLCSSAEISAGWQHWCTSMLPTHFNIFRQDLSKIRTLGNKIRSPTETCCWKNK
jgi:hypothetical protein